MKFALVRIIYSNFYIMQQCIIQHKDSKVKYLSKLLSWKEKMHNQVSWAKYVPLLKYVLCFEILQWQAIYRRHTVVQGNRGLVVDNCHHQVNHLYHKGNKMLLKCLNRRNIISSTVRSFMYDWYQALCTDSQPCAFLQRKFLSVHYHNITSVSHCIVDSGK